MVGQNAVEPVGKFVVAAPKVTIHPSAALRMNGKVSEIAFFDRSC
jgi:hypothetical protein